jgi:cytochrome c oxidase subunit 5b
VKPFKTLTGLLTFPNALVAAQFSDQPANRSLQTEVKTADDLLGPGAAPGTVPTELEQATGIERLELLGQMEGVDIFDMKPLEMTRQGWLSHTSLLT